MTDIMSDLFDSDAWVKRPNAWSKSAKPRSNNMRDRNKGYDGSYPRVYARLKAHGHDAAKALEILIACKRKDRHSLNWVRMMRRLKP